MEFDPIQHDDPVAEMEQKFESASKFTKFIATIASFVIVAIFYVGDKVRRLWRWK